MAAYYNEIEPYAAEWLRNLIARNLIAPGDVDTRSIVDVQPDDLRGYTQCHFFAGIGGWSYALRLAGWPDDRPVWTGSCPCQPFSVAGQQRGSEDERHLWPAFFRLIRECRTATVFGEQVAGAAGLAWLDHVCSDLEGEGYAAAAADLPACSVGAPHRRQRLWWVAYAEAEGPSHRRKWTVFGEFGEKGGAVGSMADADGGLSGYGNVQRSWEHGLLSEGDGTCRLAHSDCPGRGEIEVSEHRERTREGRKGHQWEPCISREVCMLGDADDARLEGRRDDAGEHAGQFVVGPSSPWRDLEWLPCSDGKARPTQPGLFPLAHGISNRVGRLRAYGNAIVPQVAAEFIGAYLEC